MAFTSFSSFNKERLFDIDTTGFEYFKLRDLFEADGEGTEYIIRGLYIGSKSEFAEESPIVALDDKYVNIPQFQLPEVKEMLASKFAIAAINRGEGAFKIEKYIKKMKTGSRVCYKAVWCDASSGDEL